jgi:hypothetical protein
MVKGTLIIFSEKHGSRSCPLHNEVNEARHVSNARDILVGPWIKEGKIGEACGTQ